MGNSKDYHIDPCMYIDLDHNVCAVVVYLRACCDDMYMFGIDK